MKTSIGNKQFRSQGFTLIEMIGVLAVIGILASLLIPKIFEAINDARVNSAAASIASVKTALADHYAKYGSMLSSNGVAVTTPVTNFDQTLLSEGFMDKLLSLKIADPTNTTVYLVGIGSLVNGSGTVTAAATPNPATAANWAFDLANTNAVNDIAGTAEVAVVLNNVLEADAKSLNDLIDGPTLGSALGVDDVAGRVKYHQNGSGIATMTIYVAHR